MSEGARVRLWGRTIGAVLLEDGVDTAVFQYTSEFAARGIEVSPLALPLRSEPYSFPALGHETFKGLPGLLAGSLPDRYGNGLINRWLARRAAAPRPRARSSASPTSAPAAWARSSLRRRRVPTRPRRRTSRSPS